MRIQVLSMQAPWNCRSVEVTQHVKVVVTEFLTPNKPLLKTLKNKLDVNTQLLKYNVLITQPHTWLMPLKQL